MRKEPQIILASGSPRRKELLEQIGMDPVILVSDAKEDLPVNDPKELVLALSKRKCLDVAERIKNDTAWIPKIVIGADTVVSIDGQILGKPADEADAESMLKHLSGRVHEVFTGVTIVLLVNGEITGSENFAEETKVHVCALDIREIRDYIATKEPMDKAGSYGIQGRFARHIDKIEGDYFNVVGLPVCAVYQAIKRLKDEL